MGPQEIQERNAASRSFTQFVTLSRRFQACLTSEGSAELDMGTNVDVGDAMASRPTAAEKAARKEAHARGAQLVREAKETLNKSARSGRNVTGQAMKSVGAQLIREAKDFANESPQRIAYVTEENRLIDRANATFHY